MFGKSSPKVTPPPTVKAQRVERKEQSFLQTGVRIDGNIDVDGDFRVEGSLKGVINVRGILMIGPKAVAEGEIWGGEVVIHGKVTGDICAEQRIQLARGAVVTGDLYCRSLVIEDGVMFDGRSHMGERTPSKTGNKNPVPKENKHPGQPSSGSQGLGLPNKKGLSGRQSNQQSSSPFSQSNRNLERQTN